jgi:hypothetical protein
LKIGNLCNKSNGILVGCDRVGLLHCLGRKRNIFPVSPFVIVVNEGEQVGFINLKSVSKSSLRPLKGLYSHSKGFLAFWAKKSQRPAILAI